MSAMAHFVAMHIPATKGVRLGLRPDGESDGEGSGGRVTRPTGASVQL
jgi:hypothetical protein